MMLFEYLDHKKDEEIARGARAVIVSNQRIAGAFGGYLKKAASQDEYSERLRLIDTSIRNVVEAACGEHEAEFDYVHTHVMSNLAYAQEKVGFMPFPPAGAEGACPHCGGPMMDGVCANCQQGQQGQGYQEPGMGSATPVSNQSAMDPTNPMYSATTAGGHKDGCECGFCANKGKGFGNDEEPEGEDEEPEVKESKWNITAADVETGDTYTSERADLPTADASGLGSEGSPKIDKGQVPKDGLSPVDIPSKEHSLERQDVETKADYNYSDQGAHSGPSDPTKNPRKTVDPDSPMQPAEWAAPRTKTFPDSGQANPVTRSSKWHVTDGIS